MQNFGCPGHDFIPLREISGAQRSATSVQRPRPAPSEQAKAKAKISRPLHVIQGNKPLFSKCNCCKGL